MTHFSTGDKVRIDTGDVVNDGTIVRCYEANQANRRNDDTLTASVYAVEYDNGALTRFHQRRSGAIYHPSQWTLEKV